MQLTFSCPGCGKDYDLPWSMAGKRARCKRCSNEFVVPAPFEATTPRSSEAIPVPKATETSHAPPLPRTTRPEPTKPPPTRPPEPADPDWPDDDDSREDEDDLALAWSKVPLRSPRPAPPVAGRPAWLIPSIVVGGVALILAVNVGFYLAYFGGGNDVADRVEPDGANPAELPGSHAGPVAKVPASVASKPAEASDLPTPAPASTATNQLDDGDVTRLLADLKAPDKVRRREALRAFLDAPPLDDRRAEVSRAFDRLAADKDTYVRGEAIRVMGVRGDARSAEILIAALRDPDSGVRDELFEAVGRLSATEKAAEAIIPWLASDQPRASKALRAIGPPAEGPLLLTVEEGADLKVRRAACRLLKEVGTSQSVPGLEKLVARKQDGELGRQAADALKTLARRHPGDDEWATLLELARSPEAGKRRDLADRLIKAEPVEARRAEVARILEGLARDVDAATQAPAIRALGSWGLEGSRTVLIERLGDPDLRPVREAIEALGKLGPSPASARAIASRIKKERGAAIEALAQMGPLAEEPVIDALKGVGNDGFLRNDLCQLLGRIGTPASLPVLRQLAAGRDGGEAGRVLKDLEARGSGEGLPALLADVTSDDRDQRRAALQKLASFPPPSREADRAAVARVLDGLWEVDDVFLKKTLREAVVRWGDAGSADALAAYLAGPDSRQWDEALAALVKLRPDARAAELLAARFTQDPRKVAEIGQKFPALAEVPLLALLKPGGDPRWRVEACRALGTLGTRAAVPDLQALATLAGDDQIARDAEEALKAIAARQ